MFHVMALSLLVGAPTDLQYYEGHWSCHGTESEQMGTLSVTRGLSDAFYVFTWQEQQVNPPFAGKTVTFASYDKSADHFVRGGFNSDGARVRLQTDGWVEGTLVWTGEIRMPGEDTEYVRITETQMDATAYATVYETSEDGANYTVKDNGECSKTD